VRGAEHLRLAEQALGYRPIPPDGMPMVGFVSEVAGLYVAAMHSGVTLAPLIGRFAVAESVHGRSEPALAPCRPDRFATA
jgi:glycine/D-amino acid oxidase-like deaminating enzyme